MYCMPGADLGKEDDLAIQKAVQLAQEATKIILCLGEKIILKLLVILVICT
jgi:beta-glucosidase